jgi:hypothetical protein
MAAKKVITIQYRGEAATVAGGCPDGGSGRPSGYPPGPPQIRTCGFPASGSSSQGFATRRSAVTPSRTLANFAIDCSFVEMGLGSKHPASFPPIGPMTRPAPFLHRVLLGEFPRFTGRTDGLRFPAGHPEALVLVAPRYHCVRSGFAPCVLNAPTRTAWG